MPDRGRFNEWGCDGPGSSKNVSDSLLNELNTELFLSVHFYIFTCVLPWLAFPKDVA